MAACYFAEMGYVKLPAGEVLKGRFIPKLKGNGATGDVIALVNALVMPHNLFLHSALVLTRKTPSSTKGINHVAFYNLNQRWLDWLSSNIDYGFIVANGSYSITAGHCVQYNCRPGDLNLYCALPSLSALCSSMQCWRHLFDLVIQDNTAFEKQSAMFALAVSHCFDKH